MRRATWLAVSLLSWCGVAGAAAPHLPRVDFLGDPLPPGAVARFGTTRLRMPKHWSGAMAFSKDGKELITASNGGLQFWDASTGKLSREVQIKGGGITWPISSDGKRMLVAMRDDELRVCEVATGRVIKKVPYPRGRRDAFVLSPDGRRVATGAEDGVIRVYTVEGKGEALVLKGHEHEVSRLAFSPDGRWLASTDYADYRKVDEPAELEYAVRVWDLEKGKQAREFGGHVGGAGLPVWMPDSRAFVVLGLSRRPRLFNVHTGKEEAQPGDKKEHYYTAAVSPDGKRFALHSSLGGRVQLWDRGSNKLVVAMPGAASRASMAFSPDGKTLAVSAPDGRSIWLRDTRTGDALPVPPGPREPITAFALSPDGKTLVTAGDDSVIRLWDFATGKTRREMEGHTGTINSVRFSPRGDFLLSTASGRSYRFPRAEEDWTLRVWRASDGKGLRRFAAPYGPVVFPDDKTFAVGQIQRREEVRRYSLATGGEVELVKGAKLTPSTLAASPDGAYLVAEGPRKRPDQRSETLRVLDLKTGKQ